MNPKVAIIILNWNGWEDTIECLESLYQINYLNYDVIVVDNGSEDFSLAKINEYCSGTLKIESDFYDYQSSNKPIKIFEYDAEKIDENINEIKNPDLKANQKLTLIKTSKNYGFAGGNNFGIKFAIKHLNADYILLLNNDTVVDTDFLKELIEVAESDDNIGFVGPKTYYYNNKNLIQTTGGCRIDLYRAEPMHVDLEEYDHGQYDKEIDIDYISGSGLLCKREVIEKIGLMDEAHFMYWEETDWCFRGAKYGYKSIYAYKSKIWHKVGKSSQTPFKIYYHNRNRVYFMKKNANTSQILIYMLYLFIIYFWFMTGVYLVYRMDKEKFMAFYNGIRDGLSLKPHIEQI
jgi:GT2 family glycosyltransferase